MANEVAAAATSARQNLSRQSSPYFSLQPLMANCYCRVSSHHAVQEANAAGAFGATNSPVELMRLAAELLSNVKRADTG
jgi:hypothetical protein